MHDEGLISESALQQVEILESRRLFSLYWELRLLLYLGVLLLTSGLGILVYKHIDTIGHQAVLAFIAIITAACFYYCFRKSPGFSRKKVRVADPFFDYILLLGCLSLLIFLGYLQYQYDVFGDHYGTATFVPMVILFFTAYYFDHLGALSLAITNLAAWAGIAITPLSILKAGNFSDSHLIFTGIALGAVLLTTGELSLKRGLKPHFEMTYANFGLHLFFIAGLAGLFTYDGTYVLWWLGLTLAAWFLYTQAFRRRSFYFIVAVILYAYIALSYVIVHLLSNMSTRDNTPAYLGLLYFIFSAGGLAILFVRLSQKLKAHDRP
ncbi:MAG TPA: DUF2157 domain-containing protein [Puia sp.]|nr:DUF2157 domain-containing protein [Puia sp.]